MTTEAFPNPPRYTVAGAGPYSVPYEYTEGAVNVTVSTETGDVELAPGQFTVTPASGQAGNLTLTDATAATYAGNSIVIWRQTFLEQGFAGQAQREIGLESQLDRTLQGLQELRSDLGRAFRVGRHTGEIDALDFAGPSLLGVDAAGAPVTFPLTIAATPGDLPVYASANAILASTEPARSVGQRWQGGGSVFEQAPPDATQHHFVTAGGAKLYVDSTDEYLALTETLTLRRGTRQNADVIFTQGVEQNLSTLVRAQWINTAGAQAQFLTVRADGNRSNNTAPVTGIELAGTIADAGVFAILTAYNCNTGVAISGEIENNLIHVAARNCGISALVDTSTNTSDENRITVSSRDADTALSLTGADKSSAKIEVFSEGTNSWAMDCQNGWLHLSGVLRGCGRVDGGGCRITSTESGRIYFSGLKLYGQIPSPNTGTLGVLFDAPNSWLEGTIILGAFDRGVWIKRCRIGSNLRITMTAAAQNGDAIRLGEKATDSKVDACEFSFNATGAPATAYGVHLDNITNSTIKLLGDVSGSGTDLYISPDSFDNVIEISRRFATSRTIVNDRVQEDNVILFRGSFTRSDLEQLNDGNYFAGMRVEALREDAARRGPAYYDKVLDEWVFADIIDEQSAANIAAATHSVNTSAKYRGKRIWDLTNKRELRASGPLPTDEWNVIDGSVTITPV